MGKKKAGIKLPNFRYRAVKRSVVVDPDQLKISTQHLLRFNGNAAKKDAKEKNTDKNHWNKRFGGSSILHANKDGRLSPRGS